MTSGDICVLIFLIALIMSPFWVLAIANYIKPEERGTVFDHNKSEVVPV